MVVNPVVVAVEPAPVRPVAARGLLVALVLLPAVALLGSESEGVGWSRADKLVLLTLLLVFGGDCESARGGGVAAWTVGRGPGIVRPGPGGVVTAGAEGWYVKCCARGDSSLIRTGAR